MGWADPIGQAIFFGIVLMYIFLLAPGVLYGLFKLRKGKKKLGSTFIAGGIFIFLSALIRPNPLIVLYFLVSMLAIMLEGIGMGVKALKSLKG